MAVLKYDSHGHSWKFYDQDGERSLPQPESTCLHCGQTWHQFQRVPLKCVPRPVFAPKAENAPDAKPEANPGVLETVHKVNGHEWDRGIGRTVVVGEPCRKCGIKYGTPDAVWTCTGQKPTVEVPIKKRDAVEAITELAVQQQVAKKTLRNEFNDSEAWVEFACAAMIASAATHGLRPASPVASIADEYLEEYRKRFPS